MEKNIALIPSHIMEKLLPILFILSSLLLKEMPVLILKQSLTPKFKNGQKVLSKKKTSPVKSPLILLKRLLGSSMLLNVILVEQVGSIYFKKMIISPLPFSIHKKNSLLQRLATRKNSHGECFFMGGKQDNF